MKGTKMNIYAILLLTFYIVNEKKLQYEPMFWIFTCVWFFVLGVFNLIKFSIRTRTMNNSKFVKQENLDIPDFKADLGNSQSGLDGIEKNKAVSHMKMVNSKLKGK